MTSPEKPSNTAEAGSTVGMQAGEIHNSTVYQVLPDSPPEKKYEVGLAYLRDGVPTRARELIDDARAHGHDNAEVRFHWVLAMLSKRSYRDLNPDERKRLANEVHRCGDRRPDAWGRALSVVHDLLDYLSGTDKDPEHALDQLVSLPAAQRDQIVHHLDLVLTGGLKDRFWADIEQQARDARESHDRKNRVWAYFEPSPAGPRARRPLPDTTTTGDRVRAGLATITAALGAGYLAKTVILTAKPLPMVAYLIAAVGAVYAIRNGARWRFLNRRLAEHETRHSGRIGMTETTDEGFAASVTRKFEYYFAKYPPAGLDAAEWMGTSAGIRSWLRNEIVELYRESRIPPSRVKWLVRFLARDARDQWSSGELFSFREKYQVSAATKSVCVLSTMVFFGLGACVVSAAFEIEILAIVAATLVMVFSSLYAFRGWSDITGERLRAAEDNREYHRILAGREDEYRRWTTKLDALRPSETQMETWLTADRTIVVEEALRHYRLAWRDVLTHALLQTPGEGSKYARVRGGPRRYSKYDIRLFLITLDGVRELGASIDFEHMTNTEIERNNFRFDAVSSVYVAKPTALSCDLELTLMNGEPRGIHVTDATGDEVDPDENLDAVARMNLEVTGFTHTLHILEGIAAEGKRWIERDPYLAKPPEGLADVLDRPEPVET
ncbi:hypothetical protein [Amycolatopsis dendrobii]|uniref:Uncharacterized protein n=1 Tax=Amycolatopsis dendrobii TaxID=2760662 RepID=A0A7W3ZE46_9PSEU|nr:hypothetical protein [Amycolatopsis dendrobii]MBB1158130.1 hypothetical protein [Amycolatopsis dendrobii]